MKRLTKDVKSFNALAVSDMNRIMGGRWVTVIKDGVETTVWIPD